MLYHSNAFRAEGGSEEEVQAIIDLDEGKLSQRDAKVFKLVRKATRNPHEVTDEECDALRASGFSDAEIVEIVAVMALATGENKFMDALDIKPGAWYAKKTAG